MSDEAQGAVKIASIQIENVKRVKAFHLRPSPDGLTIIGGNNGNGKTSVLDSIAWALGGARKEPSKAKRDGAVSDPHIHITLSNGIVVERKGKNSNLTVTDPTGQRSGQSLIDSFVSEFALDLPKFLAANAREKAQILLHILGIGDQLTALDQAEKRIYNERHAIGQIKATKAHHAESLPEFPDAPTAPVSISALISQQQTILAANGENQRKRDQKAQLDGKLENLTARRSELLRQLAEVNDQTAAVEADLAIVATETRDLVDQSTVELEAQIANFEAINQQVAANQAKAVAHDEAEQYAHQYDAKTAEINAVRSERMALLQGAALPLPGLMVEDGNLLYNGQQWDCMSGSEQLRVAVAIVRGLKPECRFVLLDKLEQMDLATLQDFGAWLQSEGLQVIATRVSTGEECTVIIEDGLPAGKTYSEIVNPITEPEPVKEEANAGADNLW